MDIEGRIRVGGIALVFAAGLASVAMSVPRSVKAGTEADEAAAARHEYTEKVAAKYNYRYGKEFPFLPSNATTDTGEFLDPKVFPTAEYCGHCHQESHKQWRESAHSNANRVPYYLKNVALLNDSKGIEFSRHCEGCHDPIALVAGALTQDGPKKRPYDQDGVTCSVCHSIQKVDTRGTGSYVMGVPAVLVDEDGKPITRKVTDGEILAHLDRHSKAVMKDFYRTSEFCSSCHKAALPRTLNDYKWQRAIFLYDEWQNSSFAKQSPLPFYVKDSVSTCQTCHMQREDLKLTDSGAKKGSACVASMAGSEHGHPEDIRLRRAGNAYREVPSEQRLQCRYLRDRTRRNGRRCLIEGSGRSVRAHQFFDRARAKQSLPMSLSRTKGIAHSHVPEQRDMYESWVEFTVKDASGEDSASERFHQAER